MCRHGAVQNAQNKSVSETLDHTSPIVCAMSTSTGGSPLVLVSALSGEGQGSTLDNKTS